MKQPHEFTPEETKKLLGAIFSDTALTDGMTADGEVPLKARAFGVGYTDGVVRAGGYMARFQPTAQFARFWLKHEAEGTLSEFMVFPEPLSGEWAGESLKELGLGDLDEEALAEYENGFHTAFLDTVEVHMQKIAEDNG